uniref:Uncharacterized protein n=1 Tax=viral metagenome TaxID=1070528 RepID=A0A6C0CBQ2_9ZZZZ
MQCYRQDLQLVRDLRVNSIDQIAAKICNWLEVCMRIQWIIEVICDVTAKICN